MNWTWLTPEVLVILVRSFWGLLIIALLFFFLKWAYKISSRERELFKQEALDDMDKAKQDTYRVDILELIKRANERFRHK